MLFMSDKRALQAAAAYVAGVHLVTSNHMPTAPIASYVEDVRALIAVTLEETSTVLTFESFMVYLTTLLRSPHASVRDFASGIIRIMAETRYVTAGSI